MTADTMISGDHAAQEGGADPSMEDILASIRRILNDGDAPEPGASDSGDTGSSIAESGAFEPAPPAGQDHVFLLDPSMMIAETRAPDPFDDLPDDVAPNRHEPETLLAPETEIATASAMDELTAALRSRPIALHRGGNSPTLEDMVRDELRPILKTWLDANLPELVERLVKAEIERVARRR